MSKRCSIVCDTPDGVRRCEVSLPESATVAEALAAARRELGEGAAEWEGGAVAIYGQLVTRQHLPLDGDRLELLRPLSSDPRSARRARVAADRPQSRASRPHKSAGRSTDER